jgi:hypothetical protein
MPPGSGLSITDEVVAVAAALSLVVSVMAFLEAWRNQRTAALEAFPIGLDGDVFGQVPARGVTADPRHPHNDT